MSWTHMAVTCSTCKERAPENVRAEFEQLALSSGGVQSGREYEARDGGRGSWLMRRVTAGLRFACPDAQHHQALIRSV